MQAPSRGPQISRRGWLLAGLLAPLFPARAADLPLVSFDGDNLHISSLGFHFLRGQSLTRLKDGDTVEYVATVSLFRDRFATPFKRVENHFFVSYDILGTGDEYAVSTPGPPKRNKSNLSQSATETWCMERVVVAPGGIAKDQDFWLQLELRTVPPKISSILSGQRGLHVDFMELVTPAQVERQVFRTEHPLRLDDLTKASGGGRRG
jgi:hypothetical protein